MTTPTYTLASHALCPYVQRAAIALLEKRLPFERRDVDLAHKPDWFLRISPLGKTPVLLVDGEPVFESAVICDFLDETEAPRLDPEAPLARARHRGWVEFASALLDAIGGFYNAPDEAALQARAQALRGRLATLEGALAPEGPYFAGAAFSLVDAAFAPAFRYFDAFEAAPGLAVFGFFDGLPRLAAWRAALAQRPSVQQAVRPEYPALLTAFLHARGSALSRRLSSPQPANGAFA